MLAPLALCVLFLLQSVSADYWYSYATGLQNNVTIATADFGWNVTRTISVQSPNLQYVYGLQAIPTMRFVYYLAATSNADYSIRRIAYARGSTPQNLVVSNISIGDQFVVNVKQNSLWYYSTDFAKGRLYRCLLNGAGCLPVLSLTNLMGLTRNVVSTKDSVIVGSYLISGPMIALYEVVFNPLNNSFIVNDLKLNYGCCYGSLSNTRLAVSTDGTIWGTVQRYADGQFTGSLYYGGRVATYLYQAQMNAPFIASPTVPNLVFLNYNPANNQVQRFYNSQLSTATGRLNFFIEPSVCPNDCFYQGVCNSQTQICSCFANYFGADCSVFCTRNSTCSNHGTCVGNGTCNCDLNWQGNACQNLITPPPQFPAAFTALNAVLNVNSSNTIYNYFYDFTQQNEKFYYSFQNRNVTNLYIQATGYNFTQFQCQSYSLQVPQLLRFQVDPSASMIAWNIPCQTDRNVQCMQWLSADNSTLWTVVNDGSNIPVSIVNKALNTALAFPYSGFSAVPPAPSVWAVPANC